MKKLVFILVVLTTLVCSCNQQKIDGSSEQVKEMVIKLLIEDLRNQFVPIILKQHEIFTFSTPTYEFLRNAKDDKKAQEIASEIDYIIGKMNPKLTKIRTVEVNKDLNMVVCEGLVDGDSGSICHIKYSAQLTDDKKEVYVKIINYSMIK